MDYQMYHRPSPIGKGKTVSLDNILSSGFFPNDILDNPEKYMPDAVNCSNAKEICNILKEIQNNPESEITIYRGTPNPELNTGDWISLSKEYVKRRYARPYSEDPRSKLYEFTVKASDISFTGKSFCENGYFGETISISQRDEIKNMFTNDKYSKSFIEQKRNRLDGLQIK